MTVLGHPEDRSSTLLSRRHRYRKNIPSTFWTHSPASLKKRAWPTIPTVGPAPSGSRNRGALPS